MSIIQISDDFNKLDVSLYGEITKLTDTLSKARVRIFYRGLNRNRTFISEDFANQLIASLPYAPVKGIFDYTNVDYEDHGEDNTDGRIYGLVAAEPNFAWEKHLDNDGVEREYACADVVLYTALYPEAKLIPGKSQSMEIYKDTLEGEWGSYEDGLPCFYFKKGSLLGLQVLGDSTEPCFQGSAFFSLYKDAKEFFNYKNINKQEDKINMEMDKSIFRLADHEKADMLFDMLNPNFNEEGNWQVDSYLLAVYDDYALCKKKANGQCFRVNYSKNEDDTVSIDETVDVFMVDVTETELKALEAMKSVAGTYEMSAEKIDELQKEVETFEETKTSMEETIAEKDATIAEKETAIEEKDATINSLNETIGAASEEKVNLEKQIEDYTAQISVLNSEKEDLTSVNEQLNAFKLSVEKEKKEAIFDDFAAHISEDTANAFKENIDKYSVEDYEKELCMAAYKEDKTIFSANSDLLYKPNTEKSVGTGALGLLNKHKNGGNE